MFRHVRVMAIALWALCLGAGAASPPAPLLSPSPGVDGGAVSPGAPSPFLGVVIPGSSAELASKFESRLERLDVKVGDVVRQGQVLARLDTRPLQQQLAAAQAALQGARADERAASLALGEAREKKGRYFTPRSLSLGIYSQEELTTVRTQAQTAAAHLDAVRAQVAERQARVAELQQNLAEAALAAPFDGVVAACPLSPGARVAAGQPVLRLLGAGGLRVRFAIPEEGPGRLKVGSPLRILLPERGLTLAGAVESLAPEVDAAARMVFALATFDAPPPDDVTAGLVVRVRAEPSEGNGGNGAGGAGPGEGRAVARNGSGRGEASR